MKDSLTSKDVYLKELLIGVAIILGTAIVIAGLVKYIPLVFH